VALERERKIVDTNCTRQWDAHDLSEDDREREAADAVLEAEASALRAASGVASADQPPFAWEPLEIRRAVQRVRRA